MRVAVLSLLIAGCGFQAPGNAPPDGVVEPSPDGSGGDPGLDAAATHDGDVTTPDGPAAFCAGTGLLKVCVPSRPTGQRTLANIDTSEPGACDAIITHDSHELCVVAADTITIANSVRATGSRPLVLLAATSIALDGTIDVSSTRSGSAGAGANPAPCMGEAGTPETYGGGGAGGAFQGAGGGGSAGSTNNADGGSTTAALALAFHAGCAGGSGGTATRSEGAPGGTGGLGGGAIALVAGGSITITSQGRILASGAGGSSGRQKSSGAGGGGSGGFIGLDAPMLVLGGNLFANGGGGGEGGGTTNSSDPGDDGASTTTTRARGGADGASFGGDGGDGSVGSALEGTAASSSDTAGGGGGGGGGAGFIYTHTAARSGSATSSPPLSM